MENKQCKHCWIDFNITDDDVAFYDKISPTFAWKKYQIPSPTFCPDCRMQRRMAHKNFFKLYKRKSSLSWKNMISMYHENTDFPVYNLQERRSDQRNPLEYGIEVDNTKTFFDQLQELHKKVPKMNTFAVNCENSDYTNGAAWSKNCYLMFWCLDNEDCSYGHIVRRSKNCIDCLYTYESENCYQCVDCLRCYNVLYGTDIEDCSDSKFLLHCKNCKNCFGCVWLHDKEYCIFNQQYSPKEYVEKMKEIKLKTVEDFEKISGKVEELIKSSTVKHFHGYTSEDVTWDYIYYSNNIHKSYDIKKWENLKYCATLEKYEDSYDCNYSGGSQLCYESVASSSYRALFSLNSFADCSNIYYCEHCFGCDHCFGCVSLKNKKYCILNKQYSKEEYEKIVGQIIEWLIIEWQRWEYMPFSLSAFGYNETITQEYFPLTKEEALKQWFKRSDYEAPFPKSDAKDVIICEVSWKPFRLIPQEVEFYKKHNLPIPTKHPDIRHAERMKLRNPRKLRARQCAKCWIDVQTTYAPERPEVVYCETCYNKEIY